MKNNKEILTPDVWAALAVCIDKCMADNLAAAIYKADGDGDLDADCRDYLVTMAYEVEKLLDE